LGRTRVGLPDLPVAAVLRERGSRLLRHERARITQRVDARRPRDAQAQYLGLRREGRLAGSAGHVRERLRGGTSAGGEGGGGEGLCVGAVRRRHGRIVAGASGYELSRCRGGGGGWRERRESR